MIGDMHALLRKISRLVLLVMLATVFSPSFGWEAAESAASHKHASAPAHAAHGDDHHGGPATEPAACADTHHHCCPGHQLGHLPGGIVDRLQPSLSKDGPDLSGNTTSRFTSRVPEGLERPPRLPAV